MEFKQPCFHFFYKRKTICKPSLVSSKGVDVDIASIPSPSMQIVTSVDPNHRLYQAPRGIKSLKCRPLLRYPLIWFKWKDTSFFLRSTYNIFIINIWYYLWPTENIFYYFYFIRNEHYNISPYMVLKPHARPSYNHGLFRRPYKVS